METSRTVPAPDKPSFLHAQGSRGRSGSHRRGGCWRTCRRSPRMATEPRARPPHQGRRGDSPVPGRGRDPRDRSVAAVQRARRDPGQRGSRRKREPGLHRGSRGAGRGHGPVHPRQHRRRASATPPSSTRTWRRTAQNPINLDKFRTLPSSQATGAQQIGRLTNLMQLTVDTSCWTRYRSDSQNPDLGDTLPQAIPDLAVGQHPAIPRSDDDLTPPDHLQAIANTAGFHFGFIEQGGTSLYASLAQRVTNPEVLRILLSIGPTETMHFQTWQDKAGNAPPLTDPTTGLTFPDLNADGELTPDQPDHARADGLPRSEVPDLLDHPPHRDRGRCHGRGQGPDRRRAVHRTITRVLCRAQRAGTGGRRG